MAKKKSTKVNGKLAAVVIVATAVLAVLIVMLIWLGRSPQQPSGQTEPSRSQTETTTPVQTTAPTDEPVQTRPTIDIPDMAQGSYEQWLSAAGIMASVFRYPDMQEVKAYFLSETPLNDPMESKGIYLQLTSGGETVLLHIYPLEQRRTEQGTKDVYSMQTGYAAYEVVERAELADLTVATMEELSVYLDQIMLPSLYEN